MELVISKELPAVRNEGSAKAAPGVIEKASNIEKATNKDSDKGSAFGCLINSTGVKQEALAGTEKGSNLKGLPNNLPGKAEDKSAGTTVKEQLDVSTMMFLAGLTVPISVSKDFMPVATDNKKAGSGMDANSSSPAMTVKDLFAQVNAAGGSAATESATSSPAMTVKDLFAQLNAAGGSAATESATSSPAMTVKDLFAQVNAAGGSAATESATSSPAMTVKDLFAQVNAAGAAAATESATSSAAMTVKDLFAQVNAAGGSAATESATSSAAMTVKDLFAQLNAAGGSAATESATAGPAMTVKDLFAKPDAAGAAAVTESATAGPAMTVKALFAQADSGIAGKGLTAQVNLNPDVPVVDKTQKPAGKPDKKIDTGMPDILDAGSKAKISGEVDVIPDIKQLKTALDSVSQAPDKPSGAGHLRDIDQDAGSTANNTNNNVNVNTKIEGAFLHQANRANTGDIAVGHLTEKAGAQTVVSDKAFVLTKKNEASIGISIEPDGLGKLDIQLSLDKGTVNAHINASQTAGKEMIEKNINQIMDSLVKEGLNVGGFSVSLRNRGGDTNNKNNVRNEYAKNISTSETGSIAAAYAGNGLINIFV